MLTACGSFGLRCTTPVSDAMLLGEAANWPSSVSDVVVAAVKLELWQPASAVAAAATRRVRATRAIFALFTAFIGKIATVCPIVFSQGMRRRFDDIAHPPKT